MSHSISIFDVNPDLDTTDLAERFAHKQRIQIKHVLTDQSAKALRDGLASQTPWGAAMQAGDGQPRDFRMEELRDAKGASAAREMMQQVHQASAKGSYGFRYARYPLVKAYQERWHPGSLHEVLIEHINTPPFLDLVRTVTQCPELVKADGQVTMFGPQHYLGKHQDQQLEEGWIIAYVLNMTSVDWHPDWGGYLLFYDDDGDVIDGYMPRFNTLNLFAVPQHHAVSYVPPHAPPGRISISGWFRDR